MKSIALALCIAAAPQSAFALLCSDSELHAGQPCTPDPGDETEKENNEIFELIKRAQGDQDDIDAINTSFIAVRNSKQATLEEQFAACERYHKAKTAQDALYNEAIRRTEALYHVRPVRTHLTIAQPADPVLSYTKDLSPDWEPKVSDSGPGKVLVIRIKDSHEGDHYDVLSMDPSLEDGKGAVTSQDGRTFILKNSLNEALKNRKLGYLANLLYHEARHFNQLDRPAEGGERRGWASPEEDELGAYGAAIKVARVLGLTKKQRDGLKTSYDTYDMEVAHERFTRLKDDPKRQRMLAAAYNDQVNLEEEYAMLKKEIEDARDAQRAQEAARQAREKEREQLAREDQERQARQNEALWDQITADAKQCGYKPIFSYGSNRFTGFGYGNGGFNSVSLDYSHPTELDLGDLRISLLLARACNDIEYGAQPMSSGTAPRACNESASLLRERFHSPAFQAKLNYMFLAPESRGYCITRLLSQTDKFTDTAAFNKFISSFARQLRERTLKEHKERQREREEQEDEEANRPPRERSSPSNDGGDYRFDPLCSCWIRRQ